MNARLSLPEAALLLAERAGVSRQDAEKFLREFSAVVCETVAAAENVKVKGLGTFKVTDVEERRSVNVNTGAAMIIPRHQRLSFTPDKALSERVNAPFAMFEAVELDEAVSEAMLSQAEAGEPPHESTEPVEPVDSNDNNESYEAPAAPATTATSPTTTTPATTTTTSPTTTTPATTTTTTATTSAASAATPAAPTTPASPAPAAPAAATTETYVECHAPRFRKGLRMGALFGVLASLIVLVLWRVLLPASFGTVTATSPLALTVEKPQSVPQAAEVVRPAPQRLDTLQDTAHIRPVKTAAPRQEVAPTTPSDQAQPAPCQGEKKPAKVYDTITKKRFLTTMAKEHYGNYNLWPYIYDENKAILGHPDRIRPGTRVVIPPAEKYGIDASDPACVAKAKKRGAEIYRQYNQ